MVLFLGVLLAADAGLVAIATTILVAIYSATATTTAPERSRTATRMAGIRVPGVAE
jgi:hypothetical protein